MAIFKNVTRAVLLNWAGCELAHADVEYKTVPMGSEDEPELEIDLAATLIKERWIINLGDTIHIQEYEHEVE